MQTVSIFNNQSTGSLVDDLGALKAQLADLKTREDVLKAELIARGTHAAEGELFRVTINEASRWTLDMNRVKAEMGEQWFTARCRVGTVTTVRVSARAGRRALAA